MASKPEFHSMLGGRPHAAGRSPGSGRLTCVPWGKMNGDIAAWDCLAEDAAEPNPFFESWYLLPSLDALDGSRNVSILRFEQDGQLRGLMPIVRPARYYGWLVPNMSNWIHANCFFGAPLTASGSEVAFWRAVLDWADANPGLALFLHLREISLGGPLHAALQAVLASDKRPWAVVQREDRALLESDMDAEAYINAALSKQKRKDLRRRFSRLCELGEVRFERETGMNTISGWIERFLTLEASGWKGNSGSALGCDPATRALFAQSLEGAAARGKLDRLSLLLDGKPIAMLATFTSPPGAFGYKTAFDETYSRFSPGVLLEREFLTILDRTDIRWCDSCASADHSVMNQIWRERRAMGRISIAIGGSLRRAAFRQLLSRELAKQPKGTQP